MLTKAFVTCLSSELSIPLTINSCRYAALCNHSGDEVLVIDHDGIVPVSAIHSTHACFKAPYLIIALKELPYILKFI